LKPALNLFEVSLGGIGMILGAGIYSLLAPVTDEAGSGVWLSFVLAAALAGIIGLCYAELASMFPVAGADYEYASRAWGRRSAFIVGWTMAVGNIIAAASVAVAFAHYFAEFVAVNQSAAAVVALVVAALIASFGIKESVRIAVVATLVEVGGLIVVIAVGIPSLPSLDAFEADRGLPGILAGAALVMFAYNGFAQIATLAEESHSSDIVPRAMIAAITATAVLYTLVALSALAVLGVSQLAAAEVPLADVVEKVLGGRAGQAIALVALFSTANTMLLHLIVGSRLTFGMAREGALPAFLASIHPRFRTPVWAIGLSVIVCCAFAVTGEIAFVAGATSFAIFVGFFSVCGSLIVLRRKFPDLPRGFRAPFSYGNLPLLPVVGSVLTACMLLNLERDVLLVGLALLALGVAGSLLQPGIHRPGREDETILSRSAPE
jgi:APA family basic amino acid/polyamine antiporter